jgi:hypothetical protein
MRVGSSEEIHMPSSGVRVLVFVVCTGLPAITLAQQCEVLLKAGDPVPNGPSSQTIVSIRNPTTNPLGDYAILVHTQSTTSATARFTHILGNIAGQPFLRSQFPLQNHEAEAAFEGGFGISNSGTVGLSSGVCYAPTFSSVLNRMDDAIWVGSTQLLRRGDAIPSLPGSLWTYASHVSMTADGKPCWIGGARDGSTVFTQRSGLFLGTLATPLLLGGTSVPGLSQPLSSRDAVGPPYGISALARHYIALVRDSSSPSIAAVVFDGALLVANESPVKEGSLVTIAGALPSETWHRFAALGTNEASSWFIAAQTLTPNGPHYILAANGNIVLRSGSTMGSLVLERFLHGASMNEHGDLASTWSIEGSASQSIILNGQVVAQTGDAVSGAGTSATLSQLGGIGSLVLGPRSPTGTVTLYIAGRIDIDGTPSTADDRDAFLALTVTAGPPSVCYPNCDGSTTPPVLNVMDFACFMNRYSAQDPYANCDGSTTPPVINVQDFTCFMNAYTIGCN